MTKRTKTNNLHYLIDPKFNKVSRLFVLSFQNEEYSTSFSKELYIKSLNQRLECINLCANKRQRRNIRKDY